MVSKKDPKYVFLIETKAYMDWMIMVRDRCKFKNGLIFPSKGKSGGLALFWKEEVQLDIQTYSQSHIDALVYGGRDVGWWHLIGFYGDPDMNKRLESWKNLDI